MALDNEPEHSNCAGPSSVEGASLTSHPRAPARDCTGPWSLSASQTRRLPSQNGGGSCSKFV